MSVLKGTLSAAFDQITHNKRMLSPQFCCSDYHRSRNMPVIMDKRTGQGEHALSESPWLGEKLNLRCWVDDLLAPLDQD
jgi:hypothetical protein